MLDNIKKFCYLNIIFIGLIFPKLRRKIMIQVDYRCGHNSYDGFMSGPNSAGGVDVRFSIKNKSQKTIKYAYLFFIPYNAVDDKVSCSITGKVENGVKLTGPIQPEGFKSGNIFENAWWNHSITRVSLSKVIVEYTDGTEETIMGNQIPAVEGGCYVATAVYGSYDCPQVWTLRRYRDDTLASTWYGRAFIRTYYAISPTLVKWFGETEWFKKMWKGKLDRMVEELQADGVESTPYEDKKW